MMMFHLLIQKKIFRRLSGYFYFMNLLSLEVPVLYVFLILRLRFVVLKIIFDNLLLFCYNYLLSCLSF